MKFSQDSHLFLANKKRKITAFVKSGKTQGVAHKVKLLKTKSS